MPRSDILIACSTQRCHFQKWLKPGGQVLMTTYVVGVNTDHPDDFKDYLSNQRGYNLVTRAKEEELWKRQGAGAFIQRTPLFSFVSYL